MASFLLPRGPLFRLPTAATSDLLNASLLPRIPRPGCPNIQSASLSTSSISKAKAKTTGHVAKPSSSAQQPGKSKRQLAEEAKRDPRIVEMIKTLSLSSQAKARPPLRMARNRHLRHWTIHRAWLLHRRRGNEARRRELMRQHQGLSDACEELRLTTGPGDHDEGYLYRVAMHKEGVWEHEGIPIEFTRPQTETPPRVAWNHDWKR